MLDFSIPSFKLSPVSRDFVGSGLVKNPWYYNELQLENVREVNKGEGIKIAVLDSGFTPHDEISNVVESISFVSGEDSKDYGGHGTSVIGILGSQCKELCGICPGAEIVSLKILNRYIEGDFGALEKALHWCIQNKPDVINLSISSKNPMPVYLEDLFTEIDSLNIVTCVSTGNDSKDVGYPAKYNSVFAIGAYDSDGNIAGFSNRGSEIDFSAPGVDIYTCSNKNNGYVHATGTSFASPIFAGLVSLFLSQHDFENTEALKKFLISHVKDMGVPGWDTNFGWGSVIPTNQKTESYKKSATREEKVILGTKDEDWLDGLVSIFKQFYIALDKSSTMASSIYHKNK
jgi:minor extracellular protease Epr